MVKKKIFYHKESIPLKSESFVESNGTILEAQSKVHFEKIIKALVMPVVSLLQRRFRNEMAYNYMKKPVFQSINPRCFFCFSLQVTSEDTFLLTIVSTLVKTATLAYSRLSPGLSLVRFIYWHLCWYMLAGILRCLTSEVSILHPSTASVVLIEG